MKVREGGRVVNAVVLVATIVNGDGHREVLGLRVATSETGAAWQEFFADLVARGLNRIRLVGSDAHTRMVDAMAAKLPGASGQRSRTHYAANLMSVTPRSVRPSRRCCTRCTYCAPIAAKVRSGAAVVLAQPDSVRRARDAQVPAAGGRRRISTAVNCCREPHGVSWSSPLVSTSSHPGNCAASSSWV